jgi:hypothetical protein
LKHPFYEKLTSLPQSAGIIGKERFVDQIRDAYRRIDFLRKNFLATAVDLKSKAISREETILKVVESKMNS